MVAKNEPIRALAIHHVAFLELKKMQLIYYKLAPRNLCYKKSRFKEA